MAHDKKVPPQPGWADKAATKPKESQKPDWEKWRSRGNVSVKYGVLLAHNIRPSPGALKRLRETDAPRARRVLSDLYTASLRMLDDNRLKPHITPIAKTQADRLRQEVSLGKFVAWAVETIDNPDMQPEFHALAVLPCARVVEADVQAYPREHSAILALGLLALYVRDLAINGKPPPPNLLIGSQKKLNAAGLAREMQEFLAARTDRPKVSEADKVAGASVESIRKVLSDAMTRFADSFVPDDREAPPTEKR